MKNKDGNALLTEWMESGEYLGPIEDFHDSKELFKYISSSQFQDHRVKAGGYSRIDWISAMIFTTDIFLWVMAKRGYTLQKSRKKLPFVKPEWESGERHPFGIN